MKDLNKGFTLIELLAVIVILGILMALTAPAIIKTIENGKQTAYDVVMTDLKSRAANYVNDNKAYVMNMLIKPIGSVAAITLQELSNEGYLELPIVNPKTGEEFDADSVRIKIERETLYRVKYSVVTDNIVTDDDCFDFDPNTHIISEYYYTNPICPTDVIIPATIGGAAVTEIGSMAFNGMGITSVVIPEGVTTLEENSFSDNLIMTVSLPSTLTYIGDYAFWTNYLSSLTIPTSVNHIGHGAFNDNYLPSNQAIIYKRNADGSIDNTTVVSYAGAATESIVIPSGVTVLGESSFESCSIESITIPSSLVTIDDYVFYDNELLSIALPNTITSIGMAAFGGNNQLTGVVLPTNLTNIRDGAFHNCDLKTLTIPASVITIGNNTFYGNGITSITMGRTGITIGTFFMNQLDNNFRTTYYAGGAGTYTGTQMGTWTKI